MFTPPSFPTSHIYNNKNKSLLEVLHSTFTSAMCDMSVSLKCIFVLFDHDAELGEGGGGQMSRRDVVGRTPNFGSDVRGEVTSERALREGHQWSG